MPSACPRYLALLSALAVSSAAAAPQVRQLPLSSAALEGAIRRAGEVVPAMTYTLPASGVLWAEAEAPTELRSPVVVQDDPTVSGGRFAVVPDRTFSGTTAGVIYSIDVRQAEDYKLSARTFWPDVGSNSFYLQLDDGEMVTWGNDEAPEHLQRWFWLSGPVWHLEPGLHRVAVWWREDGTQLDKIALGPADFTPTGLGEPAAQAWLPSHMRLTFPAFRPPSVHRWTAVAVDTDGDPAALELAVTDARGTVHPVPASGDLQTLSLSPAARTSLELSVRLTPAAATRVLGARLQYEGESSEVELSDDAIALRFDRVDGSLLSIARPDTGLRVTRDATGPPLRVQVWEPASRALAWLPDAALSLLELSADETNRRLLLRYRLNAPGGSILADCTVTLGPTPGTSRWRIELHNQARDAHIVEVEYPVVRAACIGGDDGDDWLTWPYWIGSGRLIARPSRNAPGRGTYCSGRATMHWVDLYDGVDGGRGLYLGSEDPTWLMGAIRAEADPTADAVTLALSKMPRVRPGENWASETFRLALHDGDWHAGADLYREWMDGRVTYSPPQWVVECDGWLGRGRGTNFLRDIPRHFRLAKDLGLDYVEFWGQMMAGLAAGESCCNRLYFPDPRYGTEAQFARAIAYVRGAGGHIGFYTNGQAWNPRYPGLRPDYQGLLPEGVFIPDWEREYHRYGLIRPDGGYVPQYDKPSSADPYPGLFFLMCPATEGWPRYLRSYIVGKYVEQYGVDAMYIDQVGAAEAQWCFAEDHSHGDVGAWTRGHMDNFRRIKQEARRTEPDFAIATEGFGDCYGRDVDMFLVSPTACSAAPDAYPGLLRYTLPDRVCFDGYANGNVGQVPDVDVLNSVFLYGNRFDMFPRDAQTMEYFRRLLYLRQETAALQYRGRFMDDVDLRLTSPRLQARWWTLSPEQAEGVLVTVLNPQAEAAEVSVPFDAAGEPRAYVATLDGRLAPTPCRVAAGRLTLTLPAASVCTGLALSAVKLDPPALMRLDTPIAAAGAPSRAILRYRPLSPELRGTATAVVEAPRGWTTEAVDFSLSEAADVGLPVLPPADAAGSGHPVTVRVALPTGRVLKLDRRLLVHDALEVEAALEAGELNVTLLNRSTAALRGDCHVAGPQWLDLGTPRQPFEVGSRESVRLRFPLALSGKLTTQARLLVTARAGSVAAEATVELAPPDLAPPNWGPQSYEGEVVTETAGAGTQEQELRITTASAQDRGGWRWRSAMLPPGTTWTFSGQVRTEDVRGEAGGARVRIIFLHKTRPNTGTRDPIYLGFYRGTGEWQRFEATFDVPAETGAVQIELFNWHASGRSQWRNLQLR